MNVYVDGKNHPVFTRLCGPIPKCDAGVALDPPRETQTSSKTRPVVRLVRRSTRGIEDEDNGPAPGYKALLDAIRYSGLIQDDSRKAIDLQVSQEKVRKGEVGTLIEITYPD